MKIKAAPKFILTAYVYSGVVFFMPSPVNSFLLNCYSIDVLKSPDIFIFTVLLIKTKIQSMRSITTFILVCLLMMSCDNKKTANLPPAPADVNSVVTTIKGKKYKATRLGLISLLNSDKNNPYEWFDEINDTTLFFKNLERQQLQLAMHFINDSSVEVTDNGRTNTGTWKIETQPRSDETPGIFSRITFEKEVERGGLVHHADGRVEVTRSA